MIQALKRFLRGRGYDVVRYHSAFDSMLRNEHIDTVIDVGANDGQFALDIHAKLPAAAIYSFEPLAGAYSRLVRTAAKIPSCRAFNIALGEGRGMVTINRSSFDPSSSLLPMAPLHQRLYPKTARSEPERVEMRRLDDIARELDLGPNLLVKLDVQGYEGHVLRGGSEVMRRAKALVCEVSYVPLYEGQPLFDDIYALARSFGLRYAGSRERHYREDTGDLIYEDALFVRE